MRKLSGIRADWKARFGAIRQTTKNERNRLDAIQAFRELESLIGLIHREVDPIIQAEIEAWERLNGKDHENQGFVFALSKYGNSIRTLRPCAQLNDLACENEIGGQSYLAGVERAEQDTRSFQEKE